MAIASKTKTPKAAKSAKPASASGKAALKNPAINPYLLFNGNCEAAFKHYQKVFGVKADCMYRFKDMPPSEGKIDAKFRNKIMHMSLAVGQVMLMGADTCPDPPAITGNNVTLSVCAPNAAEAKRIFKALSLRGKVVMPIAKTFWAELFGMATDRFGVTWMVNFQGDV